MTDPVDGDFSLSSCAYLEYLYNDYLENPNNFSAESQVFFSKLQDNPNDLANYLKWLDSCSSDVILKEIKKQIQDESLVDKKSLPKSDSPKINDSNLARGCVSALIMAYRRYGHFLAKLDPLNINNNKYNEYKKYLDAANYGFLDEDLDKKLDSKSFKDITFRQLSDKLSKTYTGSIGFEYMHMDSAEEVDFISNYIEDNLCESNLTGKESEKILSLLLKVDCFESFLQKRFTGAKRFSAEGSDSVVVALSSYLDEHDDLESINIAMAHRARLSVLTSIIGVPYESIFAEFRQDQLEARETYEYYSGDVKYHLGARGVYKNSLSSSAKELKVLLSPNSSHLESINAILMGKVKAKQDQQKQSSAIIIHGDSAFAGQGVVYESLNLAKINNYEIGGSLHIIIDNQIGFTTNPDQVRSSKNAADLSKTFSIPIFYVNGDEPESVYKVTKLAAAYRKKFHKDVVINIVSYRRYGHNEGDEPRFTQPLMYKQIDARSRVADLYFNKKQFSSGLFDGIKNELNSLLEKAFDSKEVKMLDNFFPFKNRWEKIDRGCSVDYWSVPCVTGISAEIVKQNADYYTNLPSNVSLNSKLARQLKAKGKMLSGEASLDWGTAEFLAFSTLLSDGYNVRLSGQDSERGTFSQRHIAFIDQETEEKHIVLSDVAQKNDTNFVAINSPLSEYSVLAFEYGYSLYNPNTLVLWEAQFGDFSNGAQIVFDQYISSAEAKWLRMSGLVVLLPHGYEGQGPEHSSARLERFLQLCANYNMQVVNCTTPASYFHVLRRQLYLKTRKPLIVMATKSLLRHPLAVSSIDELTDQTGFEPVLQSHYGNDQTVEHIILCTGKVFYDIHDHIEKENKKNTLVLRLEQIYPFPDWKLREILQKNPQARYSWCQEEPENMGAWSFVQSRLNSLFKECEVKQDQIYYYGRPEAASTAVGYTKWHIKELQNFLVKLFDK